MISTFWVLYRSLCRVHIIGRQNIPLHGPYMIAFNHLSYFDPPFVAAFWPKTPEIIAAAYLWKKAAVGVIMRMYGAIPANRDEFDRNVLKTTLNILNSGSILAIAPEGKRSRTPGLLPGRPGIAYLAEKAGVPIIPVGITGTGPGFFKRALKFKRPNLIMQIGKPFDLPTEAASGENRKAQRQHNADLVMTKIAELLPPEYRGAYAD